MFFLMVNMLGYRHDCTACALLRIYRFEDCIIFHMTVEAPALFQLEKTESNWLK
jgi:hypothetical protein